MTPQTPQDHAWLAHVRSRGENDEHCRHQLDSRLHTSGPVISAAVAPMQPKRQLLAKGGTQCLFISAQQCRSRREPAQTSGDLPAIRRGCTGRRARPLNTSLGRCCWTRSRLFEGGLAGLARRWGTSASSICGLIALIPGWWWWKVLLHRPLHVHNT